MLKLSPSQLGNFRDCPRKYANRYVAGRVPVVENTEAMWFGRLWDDVTGVWWESGYFAALTWLVDNAANIDEVDAAKISALLKNYNPPRHKYDFIGNQVAREIRPQGLRGVRLLCVADTLLRDRETGETVVRECKTTSREIEGFGPYWQRLQVDGQVGAYFHAFNAAYMLYDVTRRPGIKCCGTDEKAAGEGATRSQVLDAYQERLTAQIEENPDKYYACRIIEKTDDDAQKAMDDIVDQSRMLRESWKKSLWPRNSNHCVSVFGTCRYLEVCSGRASLDDDSLFRPFQRRM